jgi:hypothetical protein
METNKGKVTKLSDDIRQIFVNAFGEKSEMIRLCRDHPDPFRLHDKKPVLNMTQDEFVDIFNLNSNHYSPSPGQMSRFGIYCGLSLPNLIALIMKSEWEIVSEELSDRSGPNRLKLTDYDLKINFTRAVKLNKGNILNLIRNNNVKAENVTYSQIDFYIDDLLEHDTFLMNFEYVNHLYSEKEVTEEIFLRKISGPEKESYFRMKELWKTKSTELDEMLMSLERKKRLNLGLENKYFMIFGKLETERSKVVCRIEKFRIILQSRLDHPELSYRELLKLAEGKLIEAERERNEIKNKITRSQNRIDHIMPEVSVPSVSDEFRNSYMLECKKLLRKLFFLLHTDTCPDYSGLSPEKKTEINKLWLKLMKSTKEEMYSFSPSMLLYSLPDYEQLESIYKRACEILGMDPECFETGSRLEFMIRKGSSIEVIIEFMKSETGQLELHLARLELVQNEYTHEDQTQIYRQALGDINGHTEKMKREISDLKIQILKLKKQISEELIKVT